MLKSSPDWLIVQGMRRLPLVMIWLFISASVNAQQPRSQNPSPMQETARTHGRVQEKPWKGLHLILTEPLTKPVDLFLAKERRRGRLHLLVHFHGAAFVLQNALLDMGNDWAGINVQLGSGSRVYEEPFSDPARFRALIAAGQTALGRQLGVEVRFDRIVLSGFSAGYGAVEAILTDPGNYNQVDAVLLLDGIHASYVPEGRVLSEGGKIREEDMRVFTALARDAARPDTRKRFVMTHSEIFPGTFVSTTEATDYVLQKLPLRRVPVLRWGPRGMQQISEARRGHFQVLGFAGNTAPDHIDHIHALGHFLKLLLEM
ncbi:MAG: hypothetical protein EHM61_12860 [Acidobacteria bacterium]|nr:MAG: hypothetical protein EHM61_12860 [Acidobacteriota bacterium]